MHFVSVFPYLLLCLAVGSSGSSGSSRTADENGHDGLQRWEWDVNGAADPGVGGFTDRVSYLPGQTVNFKIVTDASTIGIDVLRIGNYGGHGARFVTQVNPSVSLPQHQPFTKGQPCSDCATTASWTIPTTAVSGVYVARVSRGDDLRPEKPLVPPTTALANDDVERHVQTHEALHARKSHFGNRNASHVLFVVRSGEAPAAGDVVFRTSDLSWATSPVDGSPGSFTYDHVQTSRADQQRSFFATDFPAIKYMEREGLQVHYVATADVEDSQSLLGESTTFVTGGNEAAWPRAFRQVLASLPDAEVSRVFLGAGDAPLVAEWASDARRAYTIRGLGDDDVQPTGVVVRNVAWEPKVVVIHPEHSSLAPWAHGSRVASSQRAVKLHCDAVGRFLGSFAPGAAPSNLLRLSRTQFAWTYARDQLGLHHSSAPFNHSLLFWRSRTHASTFVAASSSFAQCLDPVRDIDAAAMATPWGTVPRRIHLEHLPHGGDGPLQSMLKSVLSLAGARGGSMPPAQPHIARHVPCEVSVEPRGHDSAEVIATIDDPLHSAAVVRIVGRMLAGVVDTVQDEAHPNDRKRTYRGALEAVNGDRIVASELTCVVVTKDGFSAPRSEDPSMPSGDL